MSEPLVSIITPSFNQAQFIEDTILSVKEQDFPNLEHIIMDGGSTDGTVEILQRYEDTYNMRWVSEADQGQSHALNKGMELARGQILGWLNSDDTYLENAVSLAAGYLISHPKTMWIYGDAYWIDEENAYLRSWVSQPFSLEDLVYERQFIIQPTAFYRKAILAEAGYLDTSLDLTMDFDLFIRLGCKYEPGYLPRALATRRIHPSAKTKNRASYFGREGIQSMHKILQMGILPEEIQARKNRALSRHQARWGRACLDNRDYWGGLIHFVSAFFLSPGSFFKKGIHFLRDSARRWNPSPQQKRAPQDQKTDPPAAGILDITWYRKGKVR